MVLFHAHIYYTLSEVKVLIHLVEAIIDADLVVLIKDCFNVSP